MTWHRLGIKDFFELLESNRQGLTAIAVGYKFLEYKKR